MTEDGLNTTRGEEPPGMDESWWAAVMEDEGKESSEVSEPLPSPAERMVNPQGDPVDWEWAWELYKRDDIVDLPVIGYNRGGVLVEANSLRGFVPISHLLGFESKADSEVPLEKLSQYVGTRLCLKVIELDPERGRLVLSQRAGLAKPGRRMELLEDLSPGKRIKGTVTNITRFGVFVDLGGVEGLIHVSELSWGRVSHPSSVASCGETLEVQVISVDLENDRVALSLKELLPDPWSAVEERFEVGQIVEGEVTNVVKFGAFVGIDEGLEGLIHTSELGDGNFLHPRSVLEEGEHVRVRIIHIDAVNRRLGLSLRQVSQKDIEPSVGNLPVPEGEPSEMDIEPH